MARKHWLAALLLTATLGATPEADAGPLFRRHCPTSYSPLHYWAPGIYTASANLHPKTALLYPVDRYAGLPLRYEISRHPCPGVDPAVLYSHTLYAVPVRHPDPQPVRSPSYTPAPDDKP